MDFKKSSSTHIEDADDRDEETAHEDIEALREGNNNRDCLYYVENRSKISDPTIDAGSRTAGEGDGHPPR
jgi:NAD-dependent DNA ligase